MCVSLCCLCLLCPIDVRRDDPSLLLVLKWGGELTPAGRVQAEELGRAFRCMYPGGQGTVLYYWTRLTTTLYCILLLYTDLGLDGSLYGHNLVKPK